MIYKTVQPGRRNWKEVQIDLAEYESEIEDLANPKDELRKKIVTLADTIREWKNETARVKKTVKEQFVEILNLGLNKYKMEETALRKLVEEIFLIHDVSESYLRKLLPEELKDPSKTRISYQQKQEIEKERQRLLQQRALGSQHESEIREHDFPDDSTAESISLRPLEPEIIQLSSETGHKIDNESTELQSELSEAYKKIEKLETDVQRLSEQFIAKANLQAYSETFPLVAHIDPVKKIITRIGFEKGSGI
jgi:predicted  nucleic acid-binding Zn-ribbon protein